MTTFKINQTKQEDSKSKATVYTFWGSHDFEDEEGFPLVDVDDQEDLFSLVDAFAIKITKGNKTNFFVKRGKYGKLYNPIGMYSEGNSRKQMRHAGRPEWRFEPTNEKIFTYYTNFLKTKNLAWLNNAEREV